MPKLSRILPVKSGRRPHRQASLQYFILAGLVFAAALGAVLRVNALPVEARHQEVWYSYRQEMHYDFSARVKTGGIYQTSIMPSGDLLRVRLPVDPPQYRRVLVGKLTESIAVKMPFSFVADRPADIHAVYWVEGVLSTTNLWQKPYPLMAPTEITVSGQELRLDNFTVDIPVKAIVDNMRELTKDLELNFDPVELRVRPVVKIDVPGQREPIKASVSPEILVQIRGGDVAVEIDEPRVISDSKSFTETRMVPITMELFGMEFRVAAVRQFALTALSIFATLSALVMAVQWLRRKTSVGQDLKKLGTSLIMARNFELPVDATVVDVRTVQQLIVLHLQTDRPVIRVGDMCYLLDGSTCYRLQVRDESPGGNGQGE